MEFTKSDTQKVKGIAILFLIFHHLFLDASRYKGFDIDFSIFSEEYINTLARNMKICVAMFTFLSAYGIAYSYLKKNREMLPSEISITVLRRYIKLISGFAFVVVLIILFSFIMGQNRFTECYGTGIESVLYFMVDLAGLSQIFHTPPLIATFWYMSLAVIIILIMPVLISIYKKYGAIVLLGLGIVFSMLFPVHVKNAYESGSHAFLPVYIICVVAGIICVDKKIFESIYKFFLKNGDEKVGNVLKFFVFATLLLFMLRLRIKVLSRGIFPTYEAIITVLLIGFIFLYINKIPVLSDALQFLGTYSMNMFLIHNFIRVVWFYDFTYGFENIFIIYAVLVAISLIVSVIIEKVKTIIRYDVLVDDIIKKLETGINKQR